jgi:hypothetical protein
MLVPDHHPAVQLRVLVEVFLVLVPVYQVVPVGYLGVVLLAWPGTRRLSVAWSGPRTTFTGGRSTLAPQRASPGAVNEPSPGHSSAVDA